MQMNFTNITDTMIFLGNNDYTDVEIITKYCMGLFSNFNSFFQFTIFLFIISFILFLINLYFKKEYLNNIINYIESVYFIYTITGIIYLSIINIIQNGFIIESTIIKLIIYTLISILGYIVYNIYKIPIKKFIKRK